MGTLLIVGVLLFIVGAALGGLAVSLDMSDDYRAPRRRVVARILCAAGFILILLPFGIERVREWLAH